MQNCERNNRIFPRDDLLAEIDSALLPNDSVNSSHAPNKTKHFLIHDFSGTGKTELAIEFAYLRQKCFDAVFFISADSPELLRKAYCEIATDLGFLTTEEAAMDPARATAKVLAWLREPWLHISKPSGTHNLQVRTDEIAQERLADWLIIFDNADHISPILDYDPSGTHGALLVTTLQPKARTFSFWGPSGLEIPALSLKQAVSFLSRLVNDGQAHFDSRNEEIAKKIIDELGGSPFSLVQAASTAAQEGFGLGVSQRPILEGQDLINCTRWICRVGFRGAIDIAAPHPPGFQLS